MFKRAPLLVLATMLVATRATLCTADSLYDRDSAGNVELRTRHAFVSDFSTTPYPRPVIGSFVKQL